MKIDTSKFNPASGPNSQLVERLVEAQSLPVQAAKQRREQVAQQKNSYTSFASMVSDLGSSVEGLAAPSKFSKIRVESSHPEILDGIASTGAAVGSYEFEVKKLARANRQLAFGFADADKTAVGFGWMEIQKGDGSTFDVTVPPGSTLRDVASKINDTASDVRAQVVNTGQSSEPFRLLVSSLKTGEAAQIRLDPDTTHLDFKSIVQGSDLDLNFEDVTVKRGENKVTDLVDGLGLNAKQAQPGTKIQLNIGYDIDGTMTGIKAFTDKYNQVAGFVHEQFAADSSKGAQNASERAGGSLAADSSLRSIMRSLQASANAPQSTSRHSEREALPSNSSFKSLAEIGITTNPKTGTLNLDEQKLRLALAKDYQGVAELFTGNKDANGDGGEGIANRLSRAVRQMQSADGGVIRGHLRSFDSLIRQQDQNIDNQSRRASEREASIRRQFEAVNTRLASLNSQGEFMNARFGQGQAQAQTIAEPQARAVRPKA